MTASTFTPLRQTASPWAEYHSQARAADISPLAAPPTENPFRTKNEKMEMRRLITYVNRLSKIIDLPNERQNAAIAIFDQNGVLIRLLCPAHLQDRLEQCGFRSRMAWRLDAMGPNAVTVGLAEHCALSSCGEENYSRALHHWAIYFSPISILRISDHSPCPYGGLAIITPVEEASPVFSSIAATFSHDLSLNLHFTQTANMLYDRTGFGIITADILMNKDYATATYINQELLSLLEVGADTDPLDLIFKPVTDLIDPLPRNLTFWSIVNQQRRVNNLEMDLCVKGRTIPCIVSTDTNHQPTLNVKCTIFYVTTLSRISAQVSEKMGNSAIFSFGNIVGESSGMRAAIDMAKRVSQVDSNVLLLGESGVGKDLFAQAIHNSSPRKSKPFIAVNCGALPRDLIASELFGYAGGAFTGAKSSGNIGKFELANGGTIFLDEIGELPLELQATLLRVVEQKQFSRLGSNKVIDLDVKIIAATNVDMAAMIAERRFRPDLYYRMSTFQVSIPPLRQREMDPILLAEHFVQKISARIGRKSPTYLSENAKQKLLAYHWPGNVRELQNLMERIVQIYPESVLTEAILREQLGEVLSSGAYSGPAIQAPPESCQNVAARRFVTISREELLDALRICGNNKSAAARHLGIPRRTFYRRLHELGLCD